MYAEEHNAALLLGLKQPAIKMHGGCNAAALLSGVRMAYRLVKFDIKGKLSSNLQVLDGAMKQHFGDNRESNISITKNRH